MLRVLPPTFKPVSRQIRFHSRVVKRATLRSFPTRFAAMWQNKLHVFCYLSYLTSGALSIQPKIPLISVGTSNGTDHFGLVRPEYSGPAFKVFHLDRSGHFGRLDRNEPLYLTKLFSPVLLFCFLLTRTITKRAVAWVGSVQPECTVALGT